jgi:hypothetical protein
MKSPEVVDSADQDILQFQAQLKKKILYVYVFCDYYIFVCEWDLFACCGCVCLSVTTFQFYLLSKLCPCTHHHMSNSIHKIHRKLPKRFNVEPQSTATWLLEKRREMEEVQAALDAQKKEFQEHEASLLKRQDDSKRRDRELQDALLKFNRFLLVWIVVGLLFVLFSWFVLRFVLRFVCFVGLFCVLLVCFVFCWFALWFVCLVVCLFCRCLFLWFVCFVFWFGCLFCLFRLVFLSFVARTMTQNEQKQKENLWKRKY